ncbi:ankyrin [Dothidotthia symphoricarpi CBS 119687]|uniref:Ankyrin n=1 Tax=Dothidotthia symphoricarpi CBS 119687 TaxID=1392245 RepID=A0A6A6A2T2_9PLEO|nr:ankyrin [Dothidotthia symphoricarpi CBS 119687]KAF2125856.1 ankyrin [Dothidotthia symphoricarpi CBS 119687]
MALVSLLSQLYVRTGQIDRARSECEKALQARRRLLGKQSEASLESMALMAHIYVLLDNRARAKSCLAMIPEARRSAVIQHVEDSLGTEVHLDFSSLMTRPACDDPDLVTQSIQSRLSGSTVGLAMEDRSYRPLSLLVKTPAPSIRQSFEPSQSPRSIPIALSPLQTVSTNPRVMNDNRFKEEYPADAIAVDAASLCLSEPPEANEIPKGRHLSRKDVIAKIGCQPRDRIEEAVCDGDHSALASLLDKKKDFWRSKVRKRVRPERLTALHFAALFGEIDMARRLLGASFNVNDVPYGYSTRLSPLKIAVGARQTNMVEFLIANGAKPSEPDSWSTLAGQLMSRSWLQKTLSDAEKEFAPNRIVAVLNILMRHGWDVNAPFESSGATVLHQAVTFWMGDYRFDLDLRTAVTSFLCARGANPYQANGEGKTPYDLALASGHQDLLAILYKDSKRKGLYDMSDDPVELSG